MAPYLKEKLKQNLKKDVIHLVQDLIAGILLMRTDVNKFKKELPHMFHTRAEKLIKELESIAKQGENKLNLLLAKKINPILDVIEEWLKSSTHFSSKNKKEKPTSRAKTSKSSAKRARK